MQHAPKRSSLFLIELILAIAFFSIAAAICVQFFAKAHALQNESTKLNYALHLATSTAERFRHSDLNSFECYYDYNWNVCEEDQAIYTLKCDVLSTKTPIKAIITVEDVNSIIYELNVLKNANTEVKQ